MAREAGLFDAWDEGRLAACQARLGNPEPASQLLARHEAELASLSLAELYLALGDKEKARQHVLRAYTEAWGEGIPYANWPQLQDCRRILAEIGEPEPQPPPFDPAKAGPARLPQIKRFVVFLGMKRSMSQVAGQQPDLREKGSAPAEDSQPSSRAYALLRSGCL